VGTVVLGVEASMVSSGGYEGDGSTMVQFTYYNGDGKTLFIMPSHCP
jgi:hypothetical protein